jgi:hypothetical protein
LIKEIQQEFAQKTGILVVNDTDPDSSGTGQNARLIIRRVVQCLERSDDLAPGTLSDCRLSVHGSPYAHDGDASESRDVGKRWNFAVIKTSARIVDPRFFHGSNPGRFRADLRATTSNNMSKKCPVCLSANRALIPDSGREETRN